MLAGSAPNNSWRGVQEVCRCLGVDLRGQTSASFNMRQNYERCLFEFEDYLSTGAYIADINAGRAPSADAILPFQPRHPIASIPVPGVAPTRHTPAPRASSPQERTVTTRGGACPPHLPSNAGQSPSWPACCLALFSAHSVSAPCMFLLSQPGVDQRLASACHWELLKMCGLAGAQVRAATGG